MLGTESLFSLLDILEVEDDSSTTRIGKGTASMSLVAAERKKLDLPALEPSCIASSILASRILPHTTVRSTTSLATFLAQFDFGEDSTVEDKDIYRVFRYVCKDETRQNLLATTSIMGKIGRGLGNFRFT